MEKLKRMAQEYNITVTDEMIDQFKAYSEFLVEYNEKVNLTAITEPDEIIVKHFLDSIALLSVVDVKQGATVIDVGTGAGFPGIPLKIVRPDIRLTLLDSLNKRLVFIEELLDIIDVDAKLIHARAEDVSRETPFRDGYDLVVSRAVTNLPALVEYCLPYAEVGGRFVAYKGPDWEDEYKDSKKAISLIGGKFVKAHMLRLPDESERSLLEIKKIKETPKSYPRRGVKIARNPL